MGKATYKRIGTATSPSKHLVESPRFNQVL